MQVNPGKPGKQSLPGTARGSAPKRRGKQWSGADVSRLLLMAERELSVDRIARKLGRTEGAVRAEATRQRIKLAPTEKPAYGAPRRPGDRSQVPKPQRRAPKPQTAAGQDRVARDPELTLRLF